MPEKEKTDITAYSIYNLETKKKKQKLNTIRGYIILKLPKKKLIQGNIMQILLGIMAEKMQYDRSTIKDKNVGFEKKIFISSAAFKYPTVKLKQLKELDVNSIAADDCILFMWYYSHSSPSRNA